jgi:L-aminopeptidase/D-esterase-like protein
MRNLVTDVSGVLVGQAHDDRVRSGVTVVLFDRPATAAVDVRGGAPGTRETDLLAPERTVEAVDTIVLSGGSAFGLDAASGAMAGLAAMGRGFAVGPARVPIVPAAILFDLNNGGDKSWGDEPPYRMLGQAALAAAGPGFGLGTAGAGTGATVAGLKGGLGSASARVGAWTVGAVAAVNAVGQATIGDGPHFWAAPWEAGREFGGLGLPRRFTAEMTATRWKRRTTAQSTTLVVVATDAALSKAACKHLAVMAQAGLARALIPVHTPLDGDVVFAAATSRAPARVDVAALGELGAAAAAVTARAIARGVYEAAADRGALGVLAWRERWPGQAPSS